MNMNRPETKNSDSLGVTRFNDQRGSALVIALFILALISVFVAMALSRTAAEASAVGNETAEARTLYAAQGSLEMMTRNFNKIFETRINPSNSDLDAVRNGVVPGLQPQFTFNQERPDQTSSSIPMVLSGGPYAGLYAIRDNWRLRTTATDQGGTEIQLTRYILNNRIPIFQFGIFYNDDLELFRPPRFSFGGRVHSNGNFFVSPGSEGVYFDSRVTATQHIITQTWRNWNQSDAANSQTWIKNASGTFVQLLPTRGSVQNTTAGAADNVFQFSPPAPTSTPNPDLPPSRLNPNWATQSAVFDGNLQNAVKPLKLPLNVGANTDLVEMIKRGKEVANVNGGDLWRDNLGVLNPVTALSGVDDSIMRAERFANKTGIRVSLADSQAKLPGCASGVGTTPIAGPCGVRLDGNITGSVVAGSSDPNPADPVVANRVRGYNPRPMTDGYQATRVNGERLYTGGAREVWIKVESVRTDNATGAIVTTDITEDLLSLGVTEQGARIMNGANTQFRITAAGYNDTPPNNANLTATAAQAPSVGTDSRSVIKLQRFVMLGSNPGNTYLTPFNVPVATNNSTGVANVVSRYGNVVTDAQTAAGCLASAGPPAVTACATAGEDADPSINPNLENLAHLKRATVNNVATKAVVPFPIEMFDMREGYYYDTRSTAYYANLAQVTRNGVMSVVDIDVANLRRFLRGDFDGLFPANTPSAIAFGRGLLSTDIPEKGGWVFYVSDRRGDADFDGEYDMEDIYGNNLAGGGPNNGTLELGEDVNRSTALDAKYINPGSNACVGIVPDCEAAKYADTWAPDFAAVTDHKYYRRGVRLINGSTIPGIYDSVTPSRTRGFTVASENGIYVQGNYNATGVGVVPATGNTPFDQYLPFNTSTHIPASIVADGVTILSNAWNDGKSFWSSTISPYDQSNRLAATTQMRFAMISGDTVASRDATPNQGGISPRLNGGVHNFKRFLERWTNQRLDYAGSLINLFNSRNNNGSFKCCTTVYNPPVRNWVFDSTFLDPARLPPGTPFFQYVQTTGFERSTD